MLLTDRARMTGVLVAGVALGAALLGSCQQGGGSTAAAQPVSATRPTSSATSTSTVAAAAAVKPPKGWPAGLPAPTAEIRDAAGLQAYVDALTPAQRKVYSEALQKGMTPKQRADLQKATSQLGALAPGQLEECAKLTQPGIVATSLVATAGVDGPKMVRGRLQLAQSLDQQMKDAHLTPRTAEDIRAMTAAMRAHANDGRAMLRSAQFTSAMRDLSAYITQNCHIKK